MADRSGFNAGRGSEFMSAKNPRCALWLGMQWASGDNENDKGVRSLNVITCLLLPQMNM
jgi:hypothetical protein